MAQIPTFTRRPVDISSGAVPRTTTDLSGLARGIAAVGKAVAIRGERLRKADEQMMQIGLDKQFSDMRVKTLSFNGRSAMGLSKALLKSQGDLAKQTLGEIEDPITRQNMKAYFEKSFNDQVTWTQQYEMKEEDDYLKNVDAANRANESKKLNFIAVGDTTSIDATAAKLTADAKAVQGEKRMSSELEALYSQAVTDEMYKDQIKRWFTEAPDKAHPWFESNKKMLKEKLSPGVYNTLSDLSKGEEDRAMSLDIYKKAYAQFGANNLAAAQDIMDPANQEKYGYTTARQANAAAEMFRGNYSMNVAIERDNRKARLAQFTKSITDTVNKISSATSPEHRTAFFDNLINEIRTNIDMPLDDKTKLIGNLRKAQYERNPAKVRDMKRSIDRGDISTNYEIGLELGNGIGTSGKELETYLAAKIKLAEAGEVEDYMARSIDTYNDRTVEEASPEERRSGDAKYLLKANRDKFMIRLEAKRRVENAPVNDPRIVEWAEDLMDKMYIQKGKEITEEKAEGFWTFGEEIKRRFMDDPEADIAAEMERMKAETVTGNSPESVAGSAVKNEIKVKQGFDYLLANPRLIPGDTIEDKVDVLQGMWEVQWGIPLNDERRETLRIGVERGF